MKKLLLSAAVAVFVLIGANAQENDQGVQFGVKAGYNLATIGGDFEDNKAVSGFNVGGFVVFSLLENLLLQAEVALSKQGTRWEEGGFKDKYRLAYVNVPVFAKYRIVDKLYVEAGPQLSILADAKYIDDDDTTDAKDNFETIDIGAGVGVEYKITDHLGANARYVFGLCNINENNDTFKINNSVLQIGGSWTF
ncbi:PorT family protein [Hyunsoonleella sp. SJ7]|uniref:PorT family protein n=1 Tax=Hyunsoonleella aquatilis TaxID=2762758 RepID=A0A923HBG6_9FLAO|nr:porin family protein [Hyunsoonleella aquatilis]MBC3758757.1 PorT family protein [Hyunsoonleella aquatilis]